MPIWDIRFYPPSNEQHSPYDYILTLPSPDEKAHILRRLDTLRKLELGEWPHTWIHKIGDEIWQLTAGSNRIMYCLDEKTLVVLHACRKKGQKTRPQDIQRAEIHYAEYMAQKRGR